MGSVISQAANGIGSALGNAFAIPVKSIFGASCENVCSGPWDLICFIEHLCVSDLFKLLMIFVLSYLTLMFFYLLFKIGICQCVTKSLFKMCWAGCEAYWFALHDITSFLWHKLKNTKRVNRRRNRRRFQDVEAGFSSSSDDHSRFSRKRKSIRYGSRSHRHHHRHHVRLKTRQVSVRFKGGGSRRLRNSRQLRLGRSRNPPSDLGMSKRRRIG